MFDLAFRSSRPASQRALSDNLQRKAHFVKRTNGNVNSFVGYQSLRNFSCNAGILRLCGEQTGPISQEITRSAQQEDRPDDPAGGARPSE